MPIEVTARLLRKGGVYLCGEVIECEVTAVNLKSADSDLREDGGGDSLAWCSVQVHCQEVLNNQRVRVNRPPTRNASEKELNGACTSFVPARGENGFTVYSSRPSILFCDLELLPGESKVYGYSEALPSDDIPPSFNGQAVKYLYKVTVGVQHVNSPVKLLRLPFRVLVLSGLSHICWDDNGLSPSNPFLHAQQNRADTLDIGNQVIENITAIRNCHVYNVTTTKGRVGKFTLFKNCFKLGEDVTGCFDFENSEVSCVQMCVSLQTEEELAEEFAVRREHSTFATWAKHHVVCLCFRQMELQLQIPLTAPPTFFTDIVHLKWRLHFEFVTTTAALPSCPDFREEDSVSWEPPSDLPIETMLWDLPLKVYPSNPMNACLGSFDVDKMITITV